MYKNVYKKLYINLQIYTYVLLPVISYLLLISYLDNIVQKKKKTNEIKRNDNKQYKKKVNE